MVGAPDVDDVIEAAAELVEVVRDVGREVGVGAVGLAQHPVAVVAERRRAQPERAVLLEREPGVREPRERRRDRATVVERLLGGEDVEAHAEIGERPILLGPLHREHGRATTRDALGRLKISEPGSFALQQLGRGVLQVFAVIAALGNLRLTADRLLHARPERLREPGDLHAGIVDVELARDRVTGPLEQRRDAVAQRRAAAVADMQRTGRIGRDELDVDPSPRADGGPTVLAPLRVKRWKSAEQRVGGEPEVDESGSGDLDAGQHRGRRVERGDDALRHGARIGALATRQLHREVGGEVAVRRIAGPLERELVVAERRRHAREHGTKRVTHEASGFPACHWLRRVWLDDFVGGTLDAD